MKNFAFIFCFSLIAVGFSLQTFGQGNTNRLKVIIIRHGEKPPSGDNLSCQGLNRSWQLPAVLFKKFGIPDYTYVPTIENGKATNHVRMFQTVTPFAAKYNLVVNSKFDENDSTGIAKNIIKKDGTVLLVWEHTAIGGIAKALGVKKVPNWNGKDFDSIWIITFSKDGKATLSFDKEGLLPSANCQ